MCIAYIWPFLLCIRMNGDVAMKWLVYVPTIISILKEAIEAVETPGYGLEKKNAVLDIVRVALAAFSVPDLDKLMGVAAALVDVIVAAWNLCGKFKKVAPVQ